MPLTGSKVDRFGSRLFSIIGFMETTHMTQAQFDQEFHALLTSWNKHQELRTAGAPLPELYRSRADLDAHRLTTFKVAVAR